MSEAVVSEAAVAAPAREPVPLAHHFDDPEQQHQSAVLGMWAFLATEVMFFGGLLVAYTVYRLRYPDQFALASHHGLNVWLGGFNTFVLLCSSLCVALAVHTSQHRRRKETVGLLALTIVLGAVFLGIKGYEWAEDFHHHLFPGPNFHAEFVPEGWTAEQARPVAMFFTVYFGLTGLHGLHMIIGMSILALIAAGIWYNRIPATGERQVEICGLYWHFVDIVWVFLYPLLYLIHSRA